MPIRLMNAGAYLGNKHLAGQQHMAAAIQQASAHSHTFNSFVFQCRAYPQTRRRAPG